MRYRGPALLTILCTLFFSLTAPAVTPQFWENFSQEDLLKGTLTRVSLSSDGKLFLAPSYEMVYDTGQPYIFSMVRDKAGNLYAGTGHDGKVFKIDPGGKGSLYFESKELDVFALALDSKDVLYVGTSPDGKIYKVTGPNQATEFFNPEDKYIWSMLFDDAGNLYVGTGTRGIIYKLDRAGKDSKFYDAGDSHVTSLLRASNGNLLAGTSPGGMVIEIGPEGKGFTLLDTPMEEVRTLTLDRFGTVYAVASSSREAGSKASKTDTVITVTSSSSSPQLPIVTTGSTADKSKESKTLTVSAPGGEQDSTGSKSAVYAISKDGGAETIYSSKDQMVYDAIVRGDGSILAATGGKGRLLSIDSAKQVTVVTDSPEEQMTRFIAAGDVVYVAGSNQGKIYKLGSQLAQTGTFESKPLDAKTAASWGKISWGIGNPAGATVELATRSGNTAKPDGSWSDWSAPYTQHSGQQITNPRARYLQYRVTFKKGSGSASGAAPTDVLERVQVPYLQQNLRPQVLSISALPYGIALQKTPPLPPGTLSLSAASSAEGSALNSPRERGRDRQPLPPRQVLQPGAQSFTWKATDENDDILEYSIYFKGEGEADWKLLEKRHMDSFYTLDAASLPDGTYRLKILASDAQSNPYGKSLVGELVSNPFVISNSTPLVEITGNKINGKRVEVQFRSTIQAGHIASAEFSIDGGEWYILFPVDGIADSAREEYQWTTPDLAAGEHVIGIRSSDGNGNTGTTRLVVKIP